MLTFFRPQQLPRTTEAGLVLASDQKEGPSSSHTATENIYTAGTLEPWGRPTLLQGPAPGQWERGRRGWRGDQVLLGNVWGPRMEQRIMTTMSSLVLTRCCPCPKRHVYLHPLWSDEKARWTREWTQNTNKAHEGKRTCMHFHRHVTEQTYTFKSVWTRASVFLNLDPWNYRY